MLALSDLIDFLLELLRDPAAAAEFERDPEGVLAERGLDGVTAQDVRDARLVLSDDGGAEPSGHAPPPGGDDPVREINHTTANYTAEPSAAPVAATAPALSDPGGTVVTIDDRDTFIVQNTFSDDDITVIEDSFNDSSVDAQVDNSVTSTDVVAINAEGSFNESVENDVVAIDADNAFNSGDTTEIGDVTEIGDITVTPEEGADSDDPAADVPEQADPGATEPSAEADVVPVPGPDEEDTPVDEVDESFDPVA